MVGVPTQCFRIDLSESIHYVSWTIQFALYSNIFKRFKSAWYGVNRDSFRGLEQNAGTEIFLESTMSFLSDMSERESQMRDDYQELIELSKVVLGNPPTKIHWRTPGAIHHAR